MGPRAVAANFARTSIEIEIACPGLKILYGKKFFTFVNFLLAKIVKSPYTDCQVHGVDLVFKR
jgi:hypothetical protein